MTQTGAIVGTVQYLSPEQAEGHPVDRRADLYSAGIVLYELLTGPACRSTARRRSRSRSSTINELPGPAAASCEPGIPPALEAVVLRALEKDPARRYQSAEEFIAALEQRAPRADPPGRAGADARRAVGRRGRAARSRWWIWALVAARGGRDRRRRVLPARRQPRRRCRTSSAATAERGRRRSSSARGLEVAFVTRESDDVPRDEVISQDPEAGDGGARGHDGHAWSISGRHGRGAGARGRGRVARGRRSRRCATPASRSRSRRRSPTTCPRAT